MLVRLVRRQSCRAHGKGIKSDLVIGESNLRDADENVSTHTCR